MDDNIFYRETKRAFIKKLLHCAFLDAVGILGWLACTCFVFIFFDDPQIKLIYWLLTIGLEIAVMVPVILVQVSKYKKFVRTLQEMPQSEMSALEAQAQLRFDSYITAGDVICLPSVYRFVNISDIKQIKPVFHYVYGVVLDSAKLFINTDTEQIQLDIKKYKEMKDETDRQGRFTL